MRCLSNAILVKIRARHAKRLNNDDYRILMECSDVSNIAYYLKNKPIYCNSINDLSNQDIHRDFLESMLMKSFYDDLSSLADYDLKFNKNIFRYILLKSEIKYINSFLIFLKSNNSKNFNCTLPSFLKSKSHIKFENFNSITKYSEFLNSMKGSPLYKSVLDTKGNDEYFDINIIESNTYSYLYNVILELIYKISPKDANTIKKFLYDNVDVLNFIRLVRSKKICNVDDDYISKILFKFGDYKFDYKTIKCKFKLRGDSDDFKSLGKLERLSKTLKFKWAKKNIRFSNIAEIVGFSYIILKEIEIMNVINIIEGIRYGLSSEEIEGMLIR